MLFRSELAKVGITLKDLSTLSNEDIFKKTIQGLAQIQDAATRNALAVKLLGKNFKDIDVRQVAGIMGQIGGANVSAIQAASAAQQNLITNLNNLQSALTNVLEPLNSISASLKFTITDFEKIIKVIASAGAAFLIFTRGFSAITSVGNMVFGLFNGKIPGALDIFFKQFKMIGNNFALFFINIGKAAITATAAIGAFGLAGGTVAGVFKSLIAAAFNVIRIFARFAGVVTVIYGVIEALDFLEKKVIGTNYISQGVDFIAKSLEVLTDAFGRMLNMPTNIIGKILGIDNIIGLGDPFIALAKKAEEARKGLTSTATQASIRKIDNALLEEQKNKQEVINKLLNDYKLSLSSSLTDYKHANDLALMQLNFETNLIGKTDEQIDRATKLNAIQVNGAEKVWALEKQLADLKLAAALSGPGETAEKQKLAAYQAVYAKYVRETVDETNHHLKMMDRELDFQQVAIYNEKQRQQLLENITKQMERQATLADQLRSAYDKMKDVQFGQKMLAGDPLEGLKEVPEKIRNGGRAIQVEYARIQEEARKAAVEAGRAFAAGFEENGDILSPERANELANGLNEIAERYKAIAKVQTDNMLLSRSWSQGWKEALDEYVDNSENAFKKAGAAFGAITDNMERAIDNFVTSGKFSFGDFARSVIQDLVKIELKALASKIFSPMLKAAGSWLSSLFGFADGGDPPVGKPSLVGERGPELFVPKTAGTIIPNNQLGMVDGPRTVTNTYITNNISAVDAKSVAQLFAENRKTLLGTIALAQKESPYGNR